MILNLFWVIDSRDNLIKAYRYNFFSFFFPKHFLDLFEREGERV